MHNLNSNSYCNPSATNPSIDIYDELDHKSFTRKSKKRMLHGYFKNFPLCPGQFGSAVRASARRPKCHGFDSWSRAHTWVVGSIPSLGWGHVGVGKRQPIDVSLSHGSHGCFSLSPFLPLYLKKINEKISLGED
uniref:Uncharacterized protein n=1 Tax=Molossus molossus TaxID=27622 RepID=A0A7J8GQR8_MOLMO|nr:hypothetical protein HJG59_011298 [Molossus molossus]